jgi:quinoprotein glucose dehydrogenase
MQYSALTAIDKTNVGRLTQAWSYLAPTSTFTGFAFSPLIVDDVMYVIGKDKAIVALEAEMGKPRWSRGLSGNPTARGFNYWESADRADRRLLVSADSYLYALDARSGASVASFGSAGRIDLRTGVPRAASWPSGIQSNTPGRVFENLILLGSAPGERYDSPSGDLRAFDVVTGQLVWTFHTIPHPGEFGYDTWPPDAWTRVGGTNVWGEISIDETRGIAYFPVGSPTSDLYGANRKGTNLFGNCLLALDARTGKRLWHFQAVHHDLWDYDLAAAPKLLTVRNEGRTVDVVAQATKTGFVFVFNRETGEPLWPIEERAVPLSDTPGEQSWPTQPFPSKPPPFSRHSFTANDLNPHLDAAEKGRLSALVRTLGDGGLFRPPAVGGYLEMPGQFGGANWGATAADPRTGWLYVRAVHLATSSSFSTTRRPDEPETTETRYYGELGIVLRSNDGLPANSPPWTELVAYDLNEGTIKWRVPMGTIPSLAARGIKDTGADRTWRNAPVVTAGGILFAATGADRLARAYDADTGHVLWEAELGANPDGIPAIYEVKGKQYVVFFAASAQRGPESVWKLSAPAAQGYYAFALP